jgi:hypothetical protein
MNSMSRSTGISSQPKTRRRRRQQNQEQETQEEDRDHRHHQQLLLPAGAAPSLTPGEGRHRAGEAGNDFIVPPRSKQATELKGMHRSSSPVLGSLSKRGKFVDNQQEEEHRHQHQEQRQQKNLLRCSSSASSSSLNSAIYTTSPFVDKPEQFSTTSSSTTGRNASSRSNITGRRVAGTADSTHQNNNGGTKGASIPLSFDSTHAINNRMGPPSFLSTTSINMCTSTRNSSSPAERMRFSTFEHPTTTTTTATSTATSTNPSSSSSQSSPGRRRKVRKLPLRKDFPSNTTTATATATNSSIATKSTYGAAGSSNNLLPQHRLLSPVHQHVLGKHSSLLSNVVNTDFHRSLVGAIFDVGLTECSPLSIYENMSTRIKDSYSDFNLEKIKSKLQKYRKFKSKNKEEFMQMYHKTLEDMLTAYPIQHNVEELRSISGTSNQIGASRSRSTVSASSMLSPTILDSLSSGEIAAYLTYEVMKEDACAVESNATAGGNDNAINEKRCQKEQHQQEEGQQQKEGYTQVDTRVDINCDHASQHQKKNHASLSAQSSSSSCGKFLRSGINESLSNLRTYSDASVLQQATTVLGDTLDFPSLTPEELNSSIGKAFQHFLGLLSSLTCDIYEHRRAGCGNSVSSEAALTIASHGIPTSSTVAHSSSSWPGAYDPLLGSMMSMPLTSTTPSMAVMNEWSTPHFIECNRASSHQPPSHRHHHHQQQQQDQPQPPLQEGQHPSSSSFMLSSSSSCAIGKSDEAGAALLAGLSSVASVVHEGSGEDHEHKNTTPKASNKSTSPPSLSSTK